MIEHGRAAAAVSEKRLFTYFKIAILLIQLSDFEVGVLCCILVEIEKMEYLKNVFNECFKIGVDVKSQVSSSNIEKDVRYLFYKIYSSEIIVFHSTLVSLKDNTYNPEFWEKEIRVRNKIDEAFIDDITYNILQSFRTSFFIATMVNYETSLRSIAKEILSDYNFRKRMDEISKNVVAECKLASDYYDLNRILNTIRNSMHNGWIHRHSTISIPYKGHTFKFEEDKPIDCDNNELEFLIIELIRFWKELVLSVPVKSKPFIEHPNIIALSKK